MRTRKGDEGKELRVMSGKRGRKKKGENNNEPVLYPQLFNPGSATVL
jgi:hypothetical protein